MGGASSFPRGGSKLASFQNGGRLPSVEVAAVGRVLEEERLPPPTAVIGLVSQVRSWGLYQDCELPSGVGERQQINPLLLLCPCRPAQPRQSRSPGNGRTTNAELAGSHCTSCKHPGSIIANGKTCCSSQGLHARLKGPVEIMQPCVPG
ncbi:hypothetical protein KIL84_016179 [Mauremys mutica]|uniref:Uncharacterized protein n=1 Tax=Mauremys mutica TaxID=74926 RepID=A0A9D4AMH4_9SAUR|nr:hypothetical protein KIL84_016179 [Mauremys mutica]